jgi:hypothetical protein
MTEGAARVVAYVPDLMDRSRLGRLGDVEVVHLRSPGDLAPTARPEDLVVVDLGRAGVVEAIAAGIPGRVVGFASHVDTDLIASARAAGCTEVLPRSAFARLADLVAGSTPD